MPVTEQIPVNSSTGNGVTIVFPYTFLILANADIEVYIDDVLQTLTTHYTVSGAGNPSGGNVTFVAAPASGDVVVLRRSMAYERTKDYQDNGDLLAATLDDDMDAAILMLQQLTAEFVRALKLPKGTTTNQELSGTAADRANKLVSFDASGNVEMKAAADVSLLTVSSYIATLLDDANAAAARSTLGVTPGMDVAGADIASATTLDLTAATGNLVRITGTTPTTAVTLNNGQVVICYAVAAWPLTYHATNLPLPGSANYTCAAGDMVIFSKDGSGAIHIEIIKRDGTAVVSGGGAQIQPISASVASNALTISASALSLDFRSTTLGSGTVTNVAGTPSNLVVSSGSTLGTTSGAISRIAVLAINNAGTIELAVCNNAGTNALSEEGVISTTAEGGAGAADSANTIYSTTARTNVAYRVIGYIESTQATAGTWATAPSTIQGSGGRAFVNSRRIVQIVEGTPYTTYSSTSTVLPADDTIPQNTEGAEWASVTITPTDANNRLRIEANIQTASGSTANTFTGAIFQDSTANALAAGMNVFGGAGYFEQLLVVHEMAAGTTSPTTFKLRAGPNSGTMYVNGSNTARTLGGINAIRMRVTEIMA